MTLGLFYLPAMVEGAVLLVCLVGGFFVFRKRAEEDARVRGGLAIAFVLTAGTCIAVVMQSFYRDNDATIRARLSDIHVSLVGYRGIVDDTLVVQSQSGCTATYTLQTNGLDSGVWPLVSGTGHAVSGCGQQDLDKLFIP